MRIHTGLPNSMPGVLGFALALLTTTATLAQNAPPADDDLSLEEVVVTARKVEENLMTVPLAITAFSAKDIEAQGIKQLGDVMLMTPSFNFVNQQGGSGRNDRSANALVFRGLFLATNVGTNAGGQLFIDGAPVLGAQPPAIVDVERIEVLKGPQSVYFGRSAFSGAINFVTRDPSEEFKGRVSAEMSSFSSHDYSGALEGKIFSDKLTGRLSLRDFKRGGQFKNSGAYGGRLGEQTTQSAAASIAFKPTENFTAKLYVNLFEDDDGPPAQGAIKSSEFTGRAAGDGRCVPFSQAPAGTAATVAGVPNTNIATITQGANTRASFGFYCGTLPTLSELPSNILSADYDTSNPLTRAALFSPPSHWLVFDPNFKTDGGIRRVAFQADLRMDWTFGGGYTLTSLTGRHRDKTQTLIDLNYRDSRTRTNPLFAASPTTRVPTQMFLLMSQGKLRDFSQELRIASPAENRLRWTLGGNYIKMFTPGGMVYGMTNLGRLSTSAITQTDVETPAVFGAVYYDLSDKLTLTTEARYQKDKIKQTAVVDVAGNIVAGPASVPLQATFKSFSPRISLDYEYGENSTIYALFSRGTRPGGFNAGYVTQRINSTNPALTAIQRETAQRTVDALLAVVPSVGTSYTEEELENYEFGIKSTWLNGRARTTFTIYSDKWLNGIVNNSVPVQFTLSNGNNVSNLVGVIINNGKASLEGMEFEGSYRVNEKLTLSGTFGFNETKLTSYGLGLGNCSDCSFIYGNAAGAIGKSLPTAPETTWTLSADYNSTLQNGMKWFGRMDYQHQGSKYTDFTNIAKVGAKENVNARIGLRGEAWTVELFGTNLTDNDVLQSALYGSTDLFTFQTAAAPANPITPTKHEIRFSPSLPRMFGARVTWEF
jgi:iron complex outermembrane receptor protein